MKKVTVYSTSTCPWCVKVKDFLKENNIEFVDHDVSSNEQLAAEMIKKTGQMGVPVVEIGEEIIIGFDERRIRELLEI